MGTREAEPDCANKSQVVDGLATAEGSHLGNPGVAGRRQCRGTGWLQESNLVGHSWKYLVIFQIFCQFHTYI